MKKKHTRTNGGRKRSERGGGHLFKKVGSKHVAPNSTAAGSYYLTYIVNGKRTTQALRDEHGRAITDRDQAEAARARIIAPFTTGERVESLKAVQAVLQDAEAIHAAAVDDANPPLRIGDAWTAYRRSPERPDSGRRTLSDYEGQWTRFEEWITGTVPSAVYLRDVTSATAAQYAGDLIDAGLSPNRFNKHIGLLRLMFRVLSDAARIASNPWEKIKRKIQRPHSRRELTIPELTTVLDRADGDLALLLYLGACTGLRLGDCCTMTWGDVDLARGIVRRIPNKTAKSGKPVVVGIPPALHGRLAEIPVKMRTGYVLPDMAERYAREASLVTNRVQDHIRDCGIDTAAPGTGQRIKRGADGIPERDKDGKVLTEPTGNAAVVEVGFHSLRHTWVSMHAAAGTPGAVIQASVGHSNPAMTAHYTHVNEITARDVARALPAFAGNGTEPHREPLPSWAQALVESLTEANVALVKAALLKGDMA